MADDKWRENLPDDWQGKQAETWDGEISMRPLVWSTVAVAVAFAVAYFLNVVILESHEAGAVEEPSPLVEARERFVPPSPLLQADPEEEMEEMRATLEERLAGYGWLAVPDTDERRVHIPIERGMDLVLARHGVAPPTSPEPAEDEAVDVEAETP